jgi:adenosylcobinamide-GDP ribazoletransferase
MRSLLAAFQFLTVLPGPRTVTATQEQIGRSTPFFPLVGFFLGFILVFCNQLLEPYLATAILSVVIVTLLILMTRALHLDGLGDTFDGLGAKGGRETALQAMRDSHIGVFGLLAVLIVVVLKFRAIEVMEETRAQGLLLAPVFGRWAMVVLAYRSVSAREGLGQIMVEYVRGHQLFLATAVTLVLVFAFSGIVGLLIAIGILLFTLSSRFYLHRRLGGVTGDTFGAVGELTETFSLVAFALVPIPS